MGRQRILVTVSAAQMLTGLVGLAIAVRRRLPSDPMGVHLNLSADHLARDQVILGTARSAPGVMLLIQAVSTATLARQPSTRAIRTLGVLGAIMTFGYLVERRSPLFPGHYDSVSTPLFAGGLVGAAAMAWLGLGRSGA
jgi:hypothetical protein